MKLRILLVPAALAALVGCTETGGYGTGSGYATTGVSQPQTTRMGTIIDARTVQVGNNANATAGAVIGGVAGALVGNQFGKGSGNALMTGAGAVGGAIAGSEIAKNQGGGQYSTEWTVRLDNGQVVRFIQAAGGLRIGDRVAVAPAGGSWQIVG